MNFQYSVVFHNKSDLIFWQCSGGDIFNHFNHVLKAIRTILIFDIMFYEKKGMLTGEIHV